MSKILYFDTETTGLIPTQHGIHQLSFMIEIDGEVVKEADVKIQPFENDIIVEDALKVSGVTKEQIFQAPYLPPTTVYSKLVATLALYVDKYKKDDKFFLCGYNSQSFDSPHLRSFFEKNGDKYFGSWFWSANLDVMVLAAQHLIKERPSMKDFQLNTVAATMGIEVDETKLHDAKYDLELTRLIYKQICKTN